jgi:hypothetical protein
MYSAFYRASMLKFKMTETKKLVSTAITKHLTDSECTTNSLVFTVPFNSKVKPAQADSGGTELSTSRTQAARHAGCMRPSQLQLLRQIADCSPETRTGATRSPPSSECRQPDEPLR